MSVLKTVLVLSFSLLVLWPQRTFSLVPLDNNYSCHGNAIEKNEQSLSFSDAKSRIRKRIRRLKIRIEELLKSAGTEELVAELQAKIASLRSLRRSFRACSAGELDLASLLVELQGSYSGTYNDSSLGSGSIALDFTINGALLNGTLDLGGLLGQLIDGIIAFHGDVAGLPLPIQFDTEGTALGTLRTTISSNGDIDVITLEPSAEYENAELHMNYANGTINGNYEVVSSLSIVIAQGTFSASK